MRLSPFHQHSGTCVSVKSLLRRQVCWDRTTKRFYDAQCRANTAARLSRIFTCPSWYLGFSSYLHNILAYPPRGFSSVGTINCLMSC
jgi:hypothetical protein